ncbi:hypothetical protein AOLI_G00039130 [Acnodon oligacanthus]
MKISTTSNKTPISQTSTLKLLHRHSSIAETLSDDWSGNRETQRKPQQKQTPHFLLADEHPIGGSHQPTLSERIKEGPPTTTTPTAVVSVQTRTTTSSARSSEINKPPQSLPFVPFALVNVIFLHIIVAVVYHTKRNKELSCIQTSRSIKQTPGTLWPNSKYSTLLVGLGGVIYLRYRGQSGEQTRMKTKLETQDEVTYSTVFHSENIKKSKST